MFGDYTALDFEGSAMFIWLW